MRNYALIEKWKTQHEGVMYYFTKCLFFVGCTTILGACTDVKGFTNMDLGPYAKAPEVLKAFPTAEGFGKNATGGRNGVVVKVTNTNDDGEGSFRWALKQCSENEATTIVFTVSGKIELKSEIRCKANNFTKAGQTAPGGGICVIKNEVNFGGSENFIIRHVRFRVGDKDASGKDHNAACLRVENANNFIIDHCSFSWASEENTDFIDTHFSTVQWCISSEGLYYSVNKKGSRGYGGAWGGTSSTYHHNLFAHCNSRTPLMNGARGKDPGQDINVYMEYINNVNYNWGSQMATYGGMDESQDSEHHGWSCNFVNNYYKPGPATEPGKVSYRIANPSIADQKGDKLGLWYIADNYIEGASEEAERVRKDNWDGGVQIDDQSFMSKIKLDEPWKVTEPVTQHSPQEAYELVLEKVGATYPQRDPVDTRIINEVRTGVATYEGVYKAVKRVADASKISGIIDTQKTVGGWPELKSEPAPLDSDHDGMPDEWELRYGLNPNDASDGSKKYDDGYTYVEKYINSLCD